MTLRQVEKTIGEHRYRTTLLDTFTGINVATRITTKVGEALKAGDVEHAERILGDFLAKLTTDEVRFYVDVFAKQTEIVQADGKTPFLKDNLLFHFSGRYGEMIAWLAWCFEVNFADFFAMVRERAAPLVMQMVVSKSVSPSS